MMIVDREGIRLQRIQALSNNSISNEQHAKVALILEYLGRGRKPRTKEKTKKKIYSWLKNQVL